MVQRMLLLRLHQSGHLDERGEPPQLGCMIPVVHLVTERSEEQGQEDRKKAEPQRP